MFFFSFSPQARNLIFLSLSPYQSLSTSGALVVISFLSRSPSFFLFSPLLCPSFLSSAFSLLHRSLPFKSSFSFLFSLRLFDSLRACWLYACLHGGLSIYLSISMSISLRTYKSDQFLSIFLLPFLLFLLLAAQHDFQIRRREREKGTPRLPSVHEVVEEEAQVSPLYIHLPLFADKHEVTSKSPSIVLKVSQNFCLFLFTCLVVIRHAP